MNEQNKISALIEKTKVAVERAFHRHADRLGFDEPSHVWYSLERVRDFDAEISELVTSDAEYIIQSPRSIIYGELMALIMVHNQLINAAPPTPNDVEAFGQFINYSVCVEYKNSQSGDIEVSAEIVSPAREFLTSGKEACSCAPVERKRAIMRSEIGNSQIQLPGELKDNVPGRDQEPE